MRRAHLPQESGTWLGVGGSLCFSTVEGGRGNEISCEQDEIWMKSVHHRHRCPERMSREILVVVEVAQQGDGETLQLGRPTPQSNFPAHESRVIGLEESGIGDDRGGPRDCCAEDKLSSADRRKRQSIRRP